MDNRIFEVWYAEAMGAGSRIALKMRNEAESAYQIYEMDEQMILSHFSVRPHKSVLARLLDKDLTKAQQAVEFCDRTHVRILTPQDADFPRKLLNIVNPPVVLYVYGILPPLDERLCISIVGSRSSTVYGMTLTQKLSAGLAKCGVVVISGLARGIDTMANSGAIYGGGSTIAVMGSGINVPYPPENRDLMLEVSRHGAVMTEYPPDSPPDARHFPMRNRLICGLSEGTVVIEAHKKSGSLITANLALEQGKDVFAVPGDINNLTNEGCNDLIKSGSAKLVTSVYDILEEYEGRIHLTHEEREKWSRPVLGENTITEPPVPTPKRQKREPETPMPKLPKLMEVPTELPELQRKVLLALANGPQGKDRLIELTGGSSAALSAELTMLELDGWIESLPGQMVKRKQ